MLHPGGRSKADDKVPSSSGSHPSPLGSKTGAESGALSTNDVLKLDMTMFKSRVTVGTSLGQGSFAEVYRAVFDGVPVALKLLSAPKEADEIEKRLVMFFREARALKSCQHP